MHNNKGSPDLVAYIKYKSVCAICFFEIKRPNGIQSPDQLKFMLKFRDFTNVWYDLIIHPDQIDSRIEEITGFHTQQLNSIKGPNG